MILLREQHALAPDLIWLTLEAPDWADARPGQFVMLRCAPAHSADPLLGERFWIAATLRDQVALLVPLSTPGGRWLATAPPGTPIIGTGPLGRPLALKSQALLVLAEDASIAATLLLIQHAVRQRAAVMLLAAAPIALQMAGFVLPPEVEYQTIDGDVLDLLDLAPDRFAAPLLWADAIVGAGSPALAARLAQRIRRDRFNWKPGLAHFVLDQPLPCGVGLCGGCWHPGRRGARLICQHGPAFDLRDIL